MDFERFELYLDLKFMLDKVDFRDYFTSRLQHVS